MGLERKIRGGGGNSRVWFSSHSPSLSLSLSRRGQRVGREAGGALKLLILQRKRGLEGGCGGCEVGVLVSYMTGRKDGPQKQEETELCPTR